MLCDDNAMTTESSHLTERERCQIEVLRQEGFGARAVARALGGDPSVISRELKRNTPRCGVYAASAAPGMVASRREEQGGPRKESAAVAVPVSRGLCIKGGRTLKGAGRNICNFCLSKLIFPDAEAG